MPKYPVGYLRVESVRHESVRADSRKRLNSSSQLGPSVPERRVAARPARPVDARRAAVAGSTRCLPASRAPPRRPRRHRRPWSGPCRALRGGSAAGTRDRVGSTRLSTRRKSPNDGRSTRRTATAIARNRPGGRPGTGATSSTAPGAPARPARRHARRADTACLTQCLT